jgi:Na+-driven multidrug efflux pump
MSKKNLKKDVWLNSYPILLWLISEPLVGLIDSKIASYLNIDVLSAVGIGETVYFVFIWIFVFLAYGTTPYVSELQVSNKISKLNYFIIFGRRTSILIGLVSCLLLVSFSDILISLLEPTPEVTLK